MAKRLGGKRWFQAEGQRARAQGFPLYWHSRIGPEWPAWARTAWVRGWSM